MDKLKRIVVNIVAWITVAAMDAIIIGLLLLAAGLVWGGVLTVWQMTMT